MPAFVQDDEQHEAEDKLQGADKEYFHFTL